MKTAILTITALTALTAPATAGEFDTRCTRMTTQVAQLPGLSDAERQTMTRAIADYCSARERCLGEVKRIFQAPLTTKTLPAVPTCVTTPPLDALDRGIKTVAETSTFKAAELSSTLGAEEASFFRALNAALFPAAINRDAVAERKGLVDATAADMRDKKWPEVLRLGEGFCRDLQNISGASWYAPVTATVGSAVDKAGETAVNVAVVVTTAAGVDIPPEAIETMKNSLQVGSRAIAERGYRRERETAQRAIFGGRNTMRVYRDLKRNAVDFLAANRGDAASLTGAGNALDTFVAAARASGQAEDARVLADGLRAELARLRADYDKAFDAFTREHDDNVRNLRARITCQAEWKALASKIRGETTQSKLADMQRRLDTYFGVASNVRTALERHISSQMGELKSGLGKEINDQLEDIRLIEQGLDESDDE